jgi:hypothetical protein
VPFSDAPSPTSQACRTLDTGSRQRLFGSQARLRRSGFGGREESNIGPLAQQPFCRFRADTRQTLEPVTVRTQTRCLVDRLPDLAVKRCDFLGEKSQAFLQRRRHQRGNSRRIQAVVLGLAWLLQRLAPPQQRGEQTHLRSCYVPERWVLRCGKRGPGLGISFVGCVAYPLGKSRRMGLEGIANAHQARWLGQKHRHRLVVGASGFPTRKHPLSKNQVLHPAQQFGLTGVGVVEDLVLFLAIGWQETGIESEFSDVQTNKNRSIPGSLARLLGNAGAWGRSPRPKRLFALVGTDCRDALLRNAW